MGSCLDVLDPPLLASGTDGMGVDLATVAYDHPLVIDLADGRDDRSGALAGHDASSASMANSGGVATFLGVATLVLALGDFVFGALPFVLALEFL